MKNNKIVIIILFISIILIFAIYIKKSKSETLDEITYEISFNGIDCPTAYLKLFPNGKYEYYQYFGEVDKELVPDKGTYDYDINKIIKNIDKYEENSRGPYTIKTSDGKSYTTYNSNKELMEFLNKYNLVLDKCLTQR